jgi:methylated-DNA-[protein]-cysteine S-methyltransferase
VKLFRTILETPVGQMVAVASDTAICALEFSSSRRIARLDARLGRWFAPYEVTERSNAVIEQTQAWLSSYFTAERADADALPLDMRGAEFERRVWTALRTIPPGETTTYGAIAKQVGTPGAARAVGTANGANPIAIIVPCHRVIGANGTLTGYGGGLDRKSWLINHERRWRNALPL